MHKIIIRSKVRKAIRKYIDAYELYYENLYTDSGLGIAEEIIINQYRESALAISRAFYDAIEELFSQEQLFWYVSVWENKREITTQIENRRLFISYTESGNMRNIEDIKIVYL